MSLVSRFRGYWAAYFFIETIMSNTIVKYNMYSKVCHLQSRLLITRIEETAVLFLNLALSAKRIMHRLAKFVKKIIRVLSSCDKALFLCLFLSESEVKTYEFIQ